MFFSFAFCTFFKIFHVRLGKKSKSVSFSRVYVCVKAKLTLVSFFLLFFLHLPLIIVMWWLLQKILMVITKDYLVSLVFIRLILTIVTVSNYCDSDHKRWSSWTRCLWPAESQEDRQQWAGREPWYIWSSDIIAKYFCDTILQNDIIISVTCQQHGLSRLLRRGRVVTQLLRSLLTPLI